MKIPMLIILCTYINGGIRAPPGGGGLVAFTFANTFYLYALQMNEPGQHWYGGLLLVNKSFDVICCETTIITWLEPPRARFTVCSESKTPGARSSRCYYFGGTMSIVLFMYYLNHLHVYIYIYIYTYIYIYIHMIMCINT